MAKTKTSGVGMTNDWLAEQGVLNHKSFWAELAHFRWTARGADPHAVLVWGGWSGNGYPYPMLPIFCDSNVFIKRRAFVRGKVRTMVAQ